MTYDHVAPSGAQFNNSRRSAIKAGIGFAIMAGGINPMAASKPLLGCWEQLAQLRAEVKSACGDEERLGALCDRQAEILATAAAVRPDTAESFRTKARIALDYDHWQEGQDVAWQLMREIVAGRA